MRYLLGHGSWGAIVPHAPLLVPGVGDPRAHLDVLDALDVVRSRPADAVVLISPHGRTVGVYAHASGSLDPLAVPGFEVEREVSHELTRALAASWEEAPLEDPLDHGIVTPLLLDAVPDAPLACCPLQESTGPGKSFTDVMQEATRTLATAITDVTAGRTIAVIASAHTSAALAPHAPLTKRDGAEELEEEILGSIEHDVGGLTEIDDETWRTGDPCGRGPLLVLAHLFSGRTGLVHAYDDSEGIGYLVATIDAA